MAIIHRSGQEVFIAKENNFLKEAPNLLDVASQTTLIEAMEEDKLLEDFVDLNAAEEVNSTAHSPHTPPQITNLSHRLRHLPLANPPRRTADHVRALARRQT